MNILNDFLPYVLFVIGLLDGLILGAFLIHHKIEKESKEYVEKITEQVIQKPKLKVKPLKYKTE